MNALIVVNFIGMIILFYICHKIINALFYLNKKKFELAENESLRVCTIRFKEGLSITRTDTGEPVDELTILEYSNVGVSNANKRKS